MMRSRYIDFPVGGWFPLHLIELNTAIIVDWSSESARTGKGVLVSLHYIWWE